MTLFPDLTFTDFDITEYRFPGAFATGVACRQGTLTPPDTWSCPTLGLACVLMSRPISPVLVLSPDFWISNTPRYFSFALSTISVKELARINRKSAHLAKCSQLFNKSFYDKNTVPFARTINYWEHQIIILIRIRTFCIYLLHKRTIRFVTCFLWKTLVKFNILTTNWKGSVICYNMFNIQWLKNIWIVILTKLRKKIKEKQNKTKTVLV